MEEGKFYFLLDKYFVDFPDKDLEKNKEGGRDRPCFFTFKEEKTEIYWMIPISSKVDKYKTVYANKTRNGKRCDTLIFGEILKQERVFLVQNMCPVIDEYVGSEYKYSFYKHVPVYIDSDLKEEIKHKATRILNLVRDGNTDLVFPNIMKIEKQLLRKLKNK